MKNLVLILFTVVSFSSFGQIGQIEEGPGNGNTDVSQSDQGYAVGAYLAKDCKNQSTYTTYANTINNPNFSNEYKDAVMQGWSDNINQCENGDPIDSVETSNIDLFVIIVNGILLGVFEL